MPLPPREHRRPHRPTTRQAPLRARDATKEQAAETRSSQQTSTQATSAATTPGQTAASAPANSDHAAAQAAQPAPAPTSATTAGAPAAQGPEVAKAGGIDGLPNFGFSTSAAVASSTTAAAASFERRFHQRRHNRRPRSRDLLPRAGRLQPIRYQPVSSRTWPHRRAAQRRRQRPGHDTYDRRSPGNAAIAAKPAAAVAERARTGGADDGRCGGLQFSLRDQSFTGQNNGSGSQSAPAQLVIPEPQLAPIAATQVYTRMGLR